LAPAVDTNEQPDDAVERVAPALWRRARVRCGAVIHDALSDDAETRPANAPASLCGGMRGQGECDVGKGTGVEQIDLAPAGLLRGRADELDRHTEIVLRRGVQE